MKLRYIVFLFAKYKAVWLEKKIDYYQDLNKTGSRLWNALK